MGRYYSINFGLGNAFEGLFEDIGEAKSYAEENVELNRHHIKIHDDEGKLLSTSHWNGVAPTADEDVLVDFGKHGYYSNWMDV